MTQFSVPESLAGTRLDVVVASQLQMSRSQAAAAIGDGRVTINGDRARKGQIVTTDDIVVVVAPLPPEVAAAPSMPPVRYEDEHLLIVSKPAGLVVHAGAGHTGDTLVDALRAGGYQLAEGDDPSRPGIVHRLDRDTSGLMLVARTQQAHRCLIAALAAREVTRRYVALVRDVPQPMVGRIEGPIGRDPYERTRFSIVVTGRDAVTHYAVDDVGELETAGQRHAVAALSCRLETGRTHQIRVHLAAAGHGVIGDPLYGNGKSLGAVVGLTRQALHAVELRLKHPVTSDEIHVVDTIADDIVDAAARCGIALAARSTRRTGD